MSERLRKRKAVNHIAPLNGQGTWEDGYGLFLVFGENLALIEFYTYIYIYIVGT